MEEPVPESPRLRVRLSLLGFPDKTLVECDELLLCGQLVRFFAEDRMGLLVTNQTEGEAIARALMDKPPRDVDESDLMLKLATQFEAIYPTT